MWQEPRIADRRAASFEWRSRCTGIFTEWLVPESPRKPPRELGLRLVLRAADQATVAALVALALVFMAGYWANHAWRGERLIDIDEAPRRSIRFVVDVNQADWPELAQLPEIGQTLARRIVESRRVEGPFQDLDELRRVPGIGPRTLERMKPHLAPIADREMVAGP